MDNTNPVPLPAKALNPIEEKELKAGQALREMDQTSEGWRIVKGWLEERLNHTWVDPRTIDKPGGPSKEEWEWQELNAFHSADVAKTILVEIQSGIEKADYLSKVKAGEIGVVKSFKI